MTDQGGVGFGVLLRRLRLEASLTIEEVAEASGVLESRSLTRLGDALLATGHRDEARDVLTRCVSLGAAADPSRLAEARRRLADLDAGPDRAPDHARLTAPDQAARWRSGTG